jgi:hypothetical protein
MKLLIESKLPPLRQSIVRHLFFISKIVFRGRRIYVLAELNLGVQSCFRICRTKTPEILLFVEA